MKYIVKCIRRERQSLSLMEKKQLGIIKQDALILEKQVYKIF